MTPPKPIQIDFGHYYDHEELTGLLRSLAAAYPSLAKLSSIGQSHQGRDVWLMEISSPVVGPADAKPAYYIDANTHAEELTGSQVALHTIWHLLTGYGHDAEVTRLLDWQTFYIIPRLNPDGAEICLKLPFYEWIGNGRYLPGQEQFGPGLHYADVNGDGVIADMRIRDDAGEWKVSQADPRLMLPREPFEYGGEYYRIIPEGFIQDYDGAEIPIPRPQDGNMNRNYPAGWGPEGEEYGAGEYPMSEPELAAAVKFVKAHPNIVGATNYHTNAGVILVPTRKLHENVPLGDLMLFKRIGEIGEEITGYRLVTNEDQFNFPGAKPRLGTSSDFLYGQLGICCLTTELWDVFAEAGIKKDWFFPLRELSEADNLLLLKWSDERLAGQGFLRWMPFEHPQLGPVEIGGWQRLFMFRNPPGDALAEICRKNTDFTLKHAGMAPRVVLSSLTATQIDRSTFRVEAIVENQGYLPTNLTQQGIRIKAVKPISASIALPAGATLAAGRQEVELGHLAGRSERTMHYSRFRDWTAHRRKAEWVVRVDGSGPVEVGVEVVSEKGGYVTGRVMLRGKD
jgi:murein tripeptide amidase MpaA